MQDRVVGFDFHNTLQVKRGNQWIVPVAHLEIIRNLRGLGWRVYLISFVGSRWREESTRSEIESSGLARELGREGRDWFFVRSKQDKAPLCRQLGIQVFLDDSPEVIESLRREGIYTLPINAGTHCVHEDGYHDITLALAVERILCKVPVQDR